MVVVNLGISFSGKNLAIKYREDIKLFVESRKLKGLSIPCLATILVGGDGGSIFYINNQIKLCQELGILSEKIILEENISEEKLLELIETLNEDHTVSGIMLQVPLPKHLNEKTIVSRINPKKDIDGLTDVNTGRFYNGGKCFIPCTPKAIIEILKSQGDSIMGKHAVIIGRSNIVGKPVAQLLLNASATVTICHSKTVDLKKICREADILVVAMGKPNFITSDYIKEGAIVIDVGTTRLNGKITGDVLFEDVIEKAAFVTPVPGGVGTVTTTMLLKNVCEAVDLYVY